MNHVHKIYILILCCLCLGGNMLSVFAQTDDDYDPTSPGEPGVIEICRLTVSADPSEGAYVSGGGRYKVTGGTVYISTSPINTDDYTYTFKYWSLDGVQYTTSRNFYYTPTEGTHVLVAHYEKAEVVWDPTSPAEPSTANIKKKYHLYITSNLTGACSFNTSSGDKHEEGSQIYLRSYPNEYYKFEGWKVGDDIVSTSNGFYYTMPSAETTIQAVFSEIEYDPESPSEPSGSQTDVQTKDPDRPFITLHIGSTDNTTVDYTRVIFNDNASLDYEIGTDMGKMISTSADYQIYSWDTSGNVYSINERPALSGVVSLGIYVKTAGSVVITPTRADCTATLYDKTKNVEHDLSTGPYVFDSAAGTIDDRFELHVAAKYTLGDANGDGKVSIADVAVVTEYLNGKAPTKFIESAADADSNGSITTADIDAIVTLIKNQE